MKNKSLLEMTSTEAKAFFLKGESYCNFDLPEYFSFNALLKTIDVLIDRKSITSYFIKDSHPKTLEGVNYIILNNKDGRYGWRRMELIHPALYVALVNLITLEPNWQFLLERFKAFKSQKINCMSIPVVSTSSKADQAEQVLNWWLGVEQESIKLSTQYDHLIQVDLTDCYGAIYTHSIAWALHTKSVAKKNSRNKYAMLGDEIDTLIRHMRNGQTNGIPQGSVLMNFISEILLGYFDAEVIKKIGAKHKYKIIRYRDDYRIFIDDLSFGKNIVKIISECAADLGLKLNGVKTQISKNVVSDSIKKDKLDWLMMAKNESSLQKQLLQIHHHAISHPNTGSVVHALNDFYKNILNKDKIQDAEVQISISVDIAFHNPKTYPIASAIISKLLSTIKNTKVKGQIIRKIQIKFSKIPNTGHMEIWLQRVTYPFDQSITYGEELCKLITSNKANVWNNNWISSPVLRNAINPNKIIIKSKLKSIKPVIQSQEVDLFASLKRMDS